MKALLVTLDGSTQIREITTVVSALQVAIEYLQSATPQDSEAMFRPFAMRTFVLIGRPTSALAIYQEELDQRLIGR